MFISAHLLSTRFAAVPLTLGMVAAVAGVMVLDPPDRREVSPPIDFSTATSAEVVNPEFAGVWSANICPVGSLHTVIRLEVGASHCFGGFREVYRLEQRDGVTTWHTDPGPVASTLDPQDVPALLGGLQAALKDPEIRSVCYSTSRAWSRYTLECDGQQVHHIESTAFDCLDFGTPPPDREPIAMALLRWTGAMRAYVAQR